jgi:hypothetical protein
MKLRDIRRFTIFFAQSFGIFVLILVGLALFGGFGGLFAGVYFLFREPDSPGLWFFCGLPALLMVFGWLSGTWEGWKASLEPPLTKEEQERLWEDNRRSAFEANDIMRFGPLSSVEAGRLTADQRRSYFDEMSKILREQCNGDPAEFARLVKSLPQVRERYLNPVRSDARHPRT